MLAVLFIGFYGRVLRGNILDTINEDFVRTAKAKGLTPRRILLRHVLRTSLIPIVTLFGLDFASVLGGGAILTETVFDLHGVGQYAAQSINNFDLPPIMGVTMYGAFFIVVFSVARRPLLRLPRPADQADVMGERLLEVNDLNVHFATEDGVVRAVDGVSFELERGEGARDRRRVRVRQERDGDDADGLDPRCELALRGSRSSTRARTCSNISEREMQDYRGAEIGMIFQDPMTSLNPVYRIGEQIAEAIRAHEGVDRRTAKRRAVELLRQVGIPNPEARVDDFPHQFSGGMRQRAMIAIALSCNPDILIADEPTTALDVTIQAQIIELISRLKDDFNSAVILITHDLGVVADIADEIVVMYAGRVVERAAEARALLRPADAVHVGAARLDPAARPAAPGAAALDQGRAAVADQPAAGLRVPAALPARVREVHAGAARSRTTSRRRGTSTAAGSTSSTSGAHRDATISGGQPEAA